MKTVIFFLMFFSISSFSQDIKKHQWENRVLLVFTDDKKSDNFKHQIKILSENKKELIERKLVIYQFTENDFTTDFSEVWYSSNSMFKKYVNTSDSFKVLLLGLDGGIKLEQDKILSLEKLFTIIDGMPMRRSELKSKN
mgnify:CR=1 FL=1|tara:strand:- start:158 stop:574 length:417 start_codon:yes stop_codon:yes gene_type:complete